MTEKFKEVIQLLFDQFSREYIKAFPGSNANDCERAFLSLVLTAYQSGRMIEKPTVDRITTLIGSIR